MTHDRYLRKQTEQLFHATDGAAVSNNRRSSCFKQQTEQMVWLMTDVYANKRSSCFTHY